MYVHGVFVHIVHMVCTCTRGTRVHCTYGVYMYQGYLCTLYIGRVPVHEVLVHTYGAYLYMGTCSYIWCVHVHGVLVRTVHRVCTCTTYVFI